MTRDARTSWLAAASGVLVPVAVAVVLVPLRDDLDNANVALILAATVVAIASSGRRPATLLAALSGAAWFDFFHTRPYGSFTITDRKDIVTALVLLGVGLVVGELAIRNRHHSDMATESRAEIVRIHAIAELVATGDASEHVVMTVAGELRRLLFLRDCRFEPGPVASATRPRARVARNGEVLYGELWWSVQSMGLPGREVELPVTSQGRLLGNFILAPTPGRHVSAERRLVAVALADQAGAALTAQPLAGRFDNVPFRLQRRQPNG